MHKKDVVSHFVKPSTVLVKHSKLRVAFLLFCIIVFIFILVLFILLPLCLCLLLIFLLCFFLTLTKSEFM